MRSPISKMPKQLTLLLLSAGRRVALMECFRCDAEALAIGLRVLAVDRTPALSSACCRADEAFSAPACTSPEYGRSSGAMPPRVR